MAGWTALLGRTSGLPLLQICLLPPTQRFHIIAVMRGIWSVVVAVSALGMGFGAGSWKAGRSKVGKDVVESGEAITFLGGAGQKGSAADTVPISGPAHFNSYADAKPRLDQLLADYRALSPYELHQTPVVGERILEEVERILSLASVENLTTFIKATEPSGNAEAFVEIAFSALAKFSPADAAQNALDLWPPDAESFPGLQAVLREWAKRDSTAAGRWIASLDREPLQKAARLAYLSLMAASDPTAALATLGEVDPSKGHSYASILGQSLPLDRMPEAAKRFLEPREDGTSSSAMLGPFLASWGERDGDGMMAWLFSQDLDALGAETVQQSLQRIAATDPAALLEKISPELSTRPALQTVAGQAWWALVQTDGTEAQAIEWLRDHVASGTGFGGYAIADHFASSHVWTAEKTDRILIALKDLPPNDALTAFSQDFLERLSRYEGRTVLNHALDLLPLGSRSDRTLAFAVGHWAEGEPEAAIQWALKNLESPGARSTALRFAIGKWGEKDPHAAAAMALTLPVKERGDAFSGLAFRWAEKDPQGVLSYLKAAPDSAGVSSLTQTSFRHFSEHRGGTTYVSEALAMPPGKMRHDAVRGLFEGWALSDTAAGAKAMEKIPEGSLRDAAIQGFNGFAIRSDPKLAIDLATRISVPATRDKELISRARSWLKADATAAETAIRTNPAIPETVKAEIFKKP